MEVELEKQFNSWVDNLSKIRSLSNNTIVSYKSDVLKFFKFLESHLDSIPSIKNLRNLTITDFRSFLSYQRNNGIISNSIARNISSLKSFFNYLIKHDVLKNSPILSLKSPKLKKSLPRPINVNLAIEVIEVNRTNK